MNAEAPSLAEAALRLSLWLGVVLAAIALLAYGARKLGLGGGARAASPDAIRVVSRTALDPRKSLALVSVRGRCLVIGVTPTEISLLAELPADGEPQAETGNSFQERFADTLRRNIRKAAH